MTHTDPIPDAHELPDEPNWEIARQYMDLTLVLNRHGSPHDAERTLRHISAGSVVFTEGMVTEEGDMYKNKDRLQATINLIHAVNGVEDGTYQNAKHDLLRALAETEGSYGQTHETTLLRGLVQKDCFITSADYQAHQIAPNELLSRCVAALNDDSDPYLQPGVLAQKGKIYRAVRDKALYETLGHEIRETQGLGVMMATFSALKQAVAANTEAVGLPTDQEGKVRTYLIYGTAHKHTLQGKLNARNMPTQTIEVRGALPEYQYLVGIDDIHRQLALRSLQYSGLVSVSELPTVFELLERYNHLAPEEVTKLGLSAVQLALDLPRLTPEQATHDLEVFYRTYLPEELWQSP